MITIKIDKEVKEILESQKIHPRQPYVEVLKKMLEEKKCHKQLGKKYKK